jgi:hypothetical protein
LSEWSKGFKAGRQIEKHPIFQSSPKFLSVEMEIIWSAHPDVYDYVHSLRLSPDGHAQFVDGGGQSITGDCIGTWKRDGDVLPGTARAPSASGGQTESGDVLTLTWTQNAPYGDVEIYDPPIVLRCQLTVKEEKKLFFNGYCLAQSDQTITFDRSPCPTLERQSLFNAVEGTSDHYPLTFYRIMFESVDGYDGQTKNLRKCSQSVWTVSDPGAEFEDRIQDLISQGKLDEARNLLIPYIQKFPELWSKACK